MCMLPASTSYFVVREDLGSINSFMCSSNNMNGYMYFIYLKIRKRDIDINIDTLLYTQDKATSVVLGKWISI